MSLIVSRDLQKARISICEACPHFRSKTRTCGKPVIGEWIETAFKERKKLCGCFMDAKSQLKFGSCPLGMWGPTENEIQDLAEKESFVKSMSRAQRVTQKELDRIYSIYKEVVGDSKKSNCPPCIKEDLKKILIKIKETKND